MRLPAAVVILACLGAAACSPPARPGPPDEIEAAREETEAALAFARSAQSFESTRVTQAFERRRARERKAFGLDRVVGIGGDKLLGVRCAEPSGLAEPGPAGASRLYDDVIETPEIEYAQGRRLAASLAEGRARNLRVIARPDFPYPDLCRPGEDPLPDDALAGRTPVRAVSGPARDLHDAVRRGGAEEVSLWIARSDFLDTPDAFGLTPLAWAVLRGRTEAIDLLIKAGASPVASLDRDGAHSAAWFVARAGDREGMRRLRRSVPGWPSAVLTAAATTRDNRMLVELCRFPHQPISTPALMALAKQDPAAMGRLRDARCRFEAPVIPEGAADRTPG